VAGRSELALWFDRITADGQQGKRIERVRIYQDSPPTTWFERWLDRWNRQVGETMRYLTWQRAHDIVLLPVVGNTD
jgi:hypothetical protein